MGIHHLAIATPRIDAVHRFYTEAMGFELVKAVVNPTPEGGWAKHVFYDTGDGNLIAFWDLHGDYEVPGGGLSGSVGLPDWTNHLAFTATDRAALDAARDRWLALGLDVVEIDSDVADAAADGFGVKALPTMVAMRGGKVVGKVEGAQEASGYLRFFAKHAGE